MKNFIKKHYCLFLQSRVDKINKLKIRKTNTKMNLIKTYFIIAVICSHTGGGGVSFPMGNWVSPFFFFMPMFVFVSGYFYNSASDSKDYFSFLKDKAKTLVCPILYGILFMVS